ncbi:MAG: hypothetical protein HY028_05940 [Gammaproteobacteria bacterium]|nr:hypothetical protein [Gammaproteobacteria bacterium]
MKLKEHIVLAALSLLFSAQAFAQAPPPVQAPALDEWGLVGLTALVGVAGLIALFKRK